MRTALLLAVLLSCFLFSFAEPAERTLSGYVTDATTGEALTSATVLIAGTQQGTLTNNYGFFSLTLPEGPYTLIVSYVGYARYSETFTLDKDLRRIVELQPAATTVEEVVISAQADVNQAEVNVPQMSRVNLQVKNLMLLPAMGGEVDLLKVIQLLPGVSKGGEGSTSILVRGGDPDQNLILVDEAVVYNVSHLFGFFSVFNPDAIHDLDLVKGGFPAMYGGRLSSVIAMNTSEGNMEKFSGKGGIGLLSSRLTLQGPIVKGKGSFSLSGRRSYIDKVVRVATGQSYIPYYFYDVNAKANYNINDKNRLYFSIYHGKDILYMPEITEGEDSLDLGFDFQFDLGNTTSTLRWNHEFSPRFFSNTSLIYTQFKYNVRGEFGDNSIYIGSYIRDFSVKQDFTYYITPDNTFRFGAQVIHHYFRPNVVSAEGSLTEQFIADRPGQKLYAEEFAAYAQQDIRLHPRLRAMYGLRLTGAAVKGAFWPGVEPRASLSYTVTDFMSLKASYSHMRQYMHLVSSSTVALPTDLWYPVTKNIKPQNSDQIAAGLTYNIKPLKSLLTVEGYYKWMRNLTEYKENTNLILNDNFENQLLQGKGHSYGVEFLLKRDEGRLYGWISYTLSWSIRQFDSLNYGQPYWAKYDRRHNFAVVATYRFTDRFAFSADYVYLSGARFTPQVGQYFVPNASLTGVDLVPIYATRNSVSLNPQQRLDVNFVFMSKPKRKWMHGEWHIGAYNTLVQPQPYRTVIKYSPEKGMYYTQTSLFGFIPSIAYNFQF